jgi:hypothetical protein
MVAVIAQHKDPVLDGVGEVVLRQPQFAQGTEHSVALHAAQLAFFDLLTARQHGIVQRHRDKVVLLQILCAGDNLQRFTCADVDLADPEVVGIRMPFQLEHLPNHDVFNLAAFFFPALYFRAAHGDRFGECPHRHFIERYKFFQPSH